jgi:outer membrane protein TolC
MLREGDSMRTVVTGVFLAVSLLTVAAAAQPADTQLLQRVVGRALSVDEAVAIALEAQPAIQARLSEYAAARLRVDQALAPLLPQVSAAWTVARGQSSVLGTGAPVTRTFDDTTFVRASLSQLIFDFGKTFATTEAVRKRAEVALEDVEFQRQLITLSVKEAFTNINFSQRLIRVNEQALQRAELNLRSARGFFDVGTRPRSDVTRAEVDVANARVDLIRARNAERFARVALNTAMGLSPDTPTQVQDNLVYQPTPLERERLVRDAIGARPESRQARLRAEEAEALLRRSERDFLPDVLAGGFYGASRSDFDEVWEINLTLQWSLFDGGNRIARRREARSLLDAAQASIRAVELDIARQVEQAAIAVQEADERIQAAQVAVVSAVENFRLAQGRFDAGVGTILELTDAQLALTQAQSSEAQALADYRIELARLQRALGLR